MPFSLASVRLPEGVQVLSFTGQEGISQLYRFEILFVVPSAASATLNLDQVMEKPATLAILRDNGTRRTWWHGVFASLEYVCNQGDFGVYRAELVPRVFLNSLGTQYRAWVDGNTPRSIEDVLREVLASFSLGATGLRLELAQNTTRLLGQVVQYGESDFHFISRWMEREGISYYFDQEAEHEVLVVTEGRLPRMSTPAEVHYRSGSDPGQGFGEFMREFRGRVGVRPSTVRVRDYDDQRVEVRQDEAPVVGRGQGTQRAQEYWGGGSSTEALRRSAQMRAEQVYNEATRFSGSGLLYDLRPGYTFQLDGHPRNDYNTEYLCVELRHEGAAQVDALSDEHYRALGLNRGATYRAEVEAIAAGVQFRPARRTPTPRVYGVESAVIDGPVDSEYAQIDSQGRYKVKMRFDGSTLDAGRASMWVRMLQPNGGPDAGMHFPLRKGTEVMLVFLGGDPDQPVIAGSAPNPLYPSPVVRDNHTQNVLNTGGHNRVEMEDEAGRQYIDISTPVQRSQIHLGAHHGSHEHNWIVRTEGNGLLHTGANEDVYVGGELREHAVGQVSETYDNSHNTTVALDQANHIVRDQFNNVDRNQRTVVLVDQSTSVRVDQINTVGRSQRTHVGVDQNTVVERDQVNSVGRGQANQVAGNQVQIIQGEQTQTVMGPHTSNFASGATINSPRGYKILAEDGYDVVAKSWMKMTPHSGEMVLFKLGIYVSKAEVVAFGLSLVGAKADFGVAKVEKYKFKKKDADVVLANQRVDIVSDGVSVARGTLRIIT